MSTGSAIIRKTETGYEGIYCHFDGYRDGVGAELKAHYTDPDKVAALIALGDISSLGQEVSTEMSHSYDHPREGVTVAYIRDRGETGCETTKGKTLKEVANKIGHDGYVYLFKGGNWTCNGRAYGKRKSA